MRFGQVLLIVFQECASAEEVALQRDTYGTARLCRRQVLHAHAD